MDKTLEKVYKINLKLLAPHTLEETYQIIGKEALKLAQVDFGSILIKQDHGFERVFNTSSIWAKVKTRPKGFVYSVFKTGKARVVSGSTLAKIHPEIKEFSIRSVIIVPLSYRGKVAGVLSIFIPKNNSLTDRELINALLRLGPVASLAIEKSRLYNEVKETLETRDQFISMAAHEFRTPITSIVGYIQLLHRRIPNDDSPISRWIQGLFTESFRLTSLVKELLEVEKIKSGKLSYQWKERSLSEIINQAIDDFYFTNPERKIIFENRLRNKSDLIIADFGKMLQVMNNLLENAAKFSNPKSSINIYLLCKRRFFIIQIQDYGIGITKEELKNIFKRFYRGKAINREGIGLGLYLVKDIITHHKGKIFVKSKLGSGTIMELRIPKTKI